MCMCCTAEVDLAFPAVHSVDSSLSSQNGHDNQKDRQKGEADPGKQKEETLPAAGNAARIFPEGNETCQRGYQRPRAAHVDADQKPPGILREAAEENGGRNIADDLAGEGGDQHGPVGQKAGEQHPDRLHPGKIAGKGEKSSEGGQQSPVYGFQCVPIQKPERQDNDRQAKDIGHQPQHHGDGQTEQSAIDGGLTGVYRDLRFRHGKPVFGKCQTAQENEDGRQDEGRQHCRKERLYGKAVIAEKIEVLRIAEGRDHAAEIGGAVLQNEQERGVLFLTGRGKNEPAQRQKGQQGGIIGQKHRPEHGDDHQRRAHAPNGRKSMYHPLGKGRENMQVPQGAHYCQHAKQAGECLQVIII